VPYVYGKITLRGFDPAAKFPKVTIIFSDGGQTANRYSVGRSGSYCFRRSGGSGTLVVEVNGIEVARRTLTSFGSSQQREDFEIDATGPQRLTPATVISTNSKFSRPPNEKTVNLYKKAAEAEQNRDATTEIMLLKDIVAIDPADFIAWAKLGSVYFFQNAYTDADAAFRKCLELRTDYTSAWINVGQMRVAQKQFAAAIELFKYAASLEPDSARIYRLLGEAYLENRQGSLAVEALDQALKLDPIGQAECHLLKGHLYELAGAKQLATKEYKAFIVAVPDHPDKKKLEKFIAANPE
jgi:tetratricopeptide (TPR) repeat protein